MKKQKEFQIWSEAYAVSDKDGGTIHGAQYHGIGYGRNFGEACDDLAERSEDFRMFYSPKTGRYWGLKLYDTQLEAQGTLFGGE